MNWRLLCSWLKERYKDQRSDQDIRAAMRRRRQGNSECFDDFLDSILAIADALSEPISDSELAQTIRNNLRSDLGHDLLHIETPTIAALRKHCHRHEEFFNNLRAKNSSSYPPVRRNVNEISLDEEPEESQQGNQPQILAIRNENRTKCWNCDKLSHRFKDCPQPHRVFCYGCGAINIYKPTYPKCSQKSGNCQADNRANPRSDARLQTRARRSINQMKAQLGPNHPKQTPDNSHDRHIKPYHVRLREYTEIRRRIFTNDTCQQKSRSSTTTRILEIKKWLQQLRNISNK